MGGAGFLPTLNLSPTGHFNFFGVYSAAVGPSTINIVGTHHDLMSLGNDAPTYMSCSIDGVTSYCGLAVPEPDSWALLISGFGLIGLTLRRRPAPEKTATSA